MIKNNISMKEIFKTTALFMTWIIIFVPQCWAKKIFSQSLDQTESYKIDFDFDSLTQNFHFEFYKVGHRFKEWKNRPKKVLWENLDLFINNQKFFPSSSPHGEKNFIYFQGKNLDSKDKELKIVLSYQDNVLLHFLFNPTDLTIKEVEAAKIISSFHLRQMMNGLKSKNDKSIALTLKEQRNLTNVDLHTHFAGAIKTESLLARALEFAVPYPTSFLDKLGINYQEAATININGKVLIPLKKGNIFKSGNFLDALEILYKNMQIPVDKLMGFDALEEIYSYREPIVKYIEGPKNLLFSKLLWDLAKDYKKLGILYTELSFSKIKYMEWLRVAEEQLPLIEKELGVKIRFLVSLQRSPAVNCPGGENSEIADTVIRLKDNPYIVGIDIVGEEISSLSHCAPVLKQLGENRQESLGTHFQMRIHAGETPFFHENLKLALEMGATRIGHGIYGIDQEVIELAKKNDVIIEMNLDSNFALQNILELEPFMKALKIYLKNGVRVTLGTDGHGIYNTTLQMMEAVLVQQGLTASDWEKIQNSNQQYVEMMEQVFQRKLNKNCQGLLEKDYAN